MVMSQRLSLTESDMPFSIKHKANITHSAAQSPTPLIDFHVFGFYDSDSGLQTSASDTEIRQKDIFIFIVISD